jgi:hypothetical protein
MNLREHLRQILPEILPPTPAEAIKGTELIRLVRFRLGDDYSDATLRYHFSILSYDPTSPIAKVDQGQGYYLRQRHARPQAQGSRMGWFDSADIPAGDVGHQRYSRALVIYERLCWQRGQFPFQLNGRAGNALKVDGDWEVPDLVLADWEVETGADEQPRFDEMMLYLRRHLGGPEVGLTGVSMKLSFSLENLQAEFFQGLSATRWTTQGEIVSVEPVTDEALGDSLRSLGHQFGVGITSLGVELHTLDELPDAQTIQDMSAAEFEAVQSVLRVQRVTTANVRPALDWATLSSLRKKHPSVGELVRWLSECLERRLPLR